VKNQRLRQDIGKIAIFQRYGNESSSATTAPNSGKRSATFSVSKMPMMQKAATIWSWGFETAVVSPDQNARAEDAGLPDRATIAGSSPRIGMSKLRFAPISQARALHDMCQPTASEIRSVDEVQRNMVIIFLS
jgi:hypothetical protein